MRVMFAMASNVGLLKIAGGVNVNGESGGVVL